MKLVTSATMRQIDREAIDARGIPSEQLMEDAGQGIAERILANLLPYLRGDIVVSRLFTSNIRRSQIAIGEYPGNKTKWMNELRKYIYNHDINQGNETDVEYDFRKIYE